MSEPAAPYLVDSDGPRRPRIALMGEFSAGKSTLANLMIGSEPVPMQVVATQLPPVWISFGTQPAYLVGLDGTETPCDPENLQDIDPAQTAYVRIFCEEDMLKLCDIIDMPGISDPNMDASVWERIMPMADGVIWCSPATQAWRQSEAAVWDALAPEIRDHSILLLTRADMLTSDRDRAKVLRRVLAETETLFAKVVPISLLQARAAEEDTAAWTDCGAEGFVAAFLDVIAVLNMQLGNDVDEFDFGTVTALEASSACAADHRPPHGTPASDARVLPRRPTAKTPGQRAAPPPHPEDTAAFTPKFS